MEAKMKKNNYLVPTNKKELLKYINEKGISDLICVSSNDPSSNLVFFGLEIHTKDDKVFSITQELINAPKFGPMRVEDFSTGNGYDVISLGTTFNHKTYKYKAAGWSIKGCLVSSEFKEYEEESE
jgi:hypothetical protein